MDERGEKRTDGAEGPMAGHLGQAVATGRDLYRRGAVAVGRTAGDNGALTLLAAGTALAALSWLAARRRRGAEDAGAPDRWDEPDT